MRKLILLFPLALHAQMSMGVLAGGSAGGSVCVATLCFSRQITVDRTLAASSNQTGVPVLVSISDASMKIVGSGGKIQNSTTQASGPAVTMPADLIFTSDNACATKIPWEIEFWDSVNGILIAHVKFSYNGSGAGSNSSFYVCFGGSTVTTPQNTSGNAPSAVWSTVGYAGIYHLSSGLSVTDSTSGGLGNGTNSGATATTSGQIDGAGSFAAVSTQYIDLGNTAFHVGAGTLTLECWIKPATLAAGDIISKGFDGANTEWELSFQASGKLSWRSFSSAAPQGIVNSTATLSAGTWYHVVATFSVTAYKLYINGVLDSSASAAAPPSTVQKVEMGAVDVIGTPSSFFNGVIDEMRVNASLAASADFIADQYANQNTPGNIGSAAFLIYGGEVNN